MELLIDKIKKHFLSDYMLNKEKYYINSEDDSIKQRSEEIGELSKPISSYSSGILFLFLIRIFRNIFACVSLLRNTPFFT